MTTPASANALTLEAIGSFDTPTYVTSDPGDPNRLFVVERSGRIQLVENGSTTTFLDIESTVLSPPDDPDSNNDHGLYSMAFSPDFATDHLFYLAYSGVDDPYTGEDESGDWHLDEFSGDGDTADPASRREVLTVEYPAAQLDEQLHYGGQLQFGPDGYLYASTGDGGPQADPNGDAQNVENLLGSILRIDPTGSGSGAYTVPADNPFTDTTGCSDGCDEIWSYGLRNPWRFSFDRLTGNLVIGDVGYEDWEEVDFETGPDPGKGDNFGWNCREGAHPGPGESSSACADPAGSLTDPAFEYANGAPEPCAITGGYVVRDRALDDIHGRYVYADLCVGELRSFDPAEPFASDRPEGSFVFFVTSFGEDADCRLYVASLDGPVYRLVEPASAGPVGCEPPDTSIDSGPAQGATTNDATPTFGFSSIEPNSSFECRVDGGGFSACTSSHTTNPLPHGHHSFAVRALNPAGKPDPTPALREFTVDALPDDTPPSVPVPADEDVPSPADGGHDFEPLTLDLDAKKQDLRRKLKFFATATADSTLVVKGKSVKKKTKKLASSDRTRVRAKLKRAKRKRLARRLTRKGKAKVKVKASAIDRSGATAEDKVKLKLRERPDGRPE